MPVTGFGPTTRARKWLLGAGIFAGLLVLLAVVVARLIPSDEELARCASGELEAALGVPVSISALHWRLLPSPLVGLKTQLLASRSQLKSSA